MSLAACDNTPVGPTCDPACPAGQVCDEMLGFCRKVTPDMAGNTGDGGTAAPAWPKAGGNFASKYYNIDASENVVGLTGAITVDKSNNVILAGGFQGTVDASNTVKADTALTSAGGRDGFVAKYDADLKFQWQVKLGGPGVDYITSVATDSSGNIYVAGFSGSGTSIGGMTANPANAKGNIFLAKLSSTGTAQWAKFIGIPTELDPVSMQAVPKYDRRPAVASDGSNVYFLSAYGGTIDLGGGFLDGLGTMPLAIGAFSGDGTHLWSKKLGDFTGGTYLTLAADSSGAVLAGDLKSMASLTLGTGGAALTVSPDGMFVGRMSAAKGDNVWAKAIAGASARAVAVDGTGTVSVGGALPAPPATAVFGATTLTPMAVDNGFLARFIGGTGAISGTPRAYKSTQAATIRAVGSATDGSNDYAVTGVFRNDANLGGSNYGGGVTTFSRSALVARYKSDGTWVADGFITSPTMEGSPPGIHTGDFIVPTSDGGYVAMISVYPTLASTVVQQLGIYKLKIVPKM